MKEKYRHELKYSISYRDYLIIKSRLVLIMLSDPHTNADGVYHIYSVYFDNYSNKANFLYTEIAISYVENFINQEVGKQLDEF